MFALLSVSFGLMTRIAFGASRNPAWPDTALVMLAFLLGATLVMGWRTRGAADRRGESLIPWFAGIPGWFGLVVGSIAGACMVGGAVAYFALGTGFWIAAQLNVVGLGALALSQILPPLRRT